MKNDLWVQGGFIVKVFRTFCTLITQNLQWGGLLSTYTNGFQSLISHQWTSFCGIPKGLCSTMSNHLTNFIYLKLKLGLNYTQYTGGIRFKVGKQNLVLDSTGITFISELFNNKWNNSTWGNVLVVHQLLMPMRYSDCL